MPELPAAHLVETLGQPERGASANVQCQNVAIRPCHSCATEPNLTTEQESLTDFQLQVQQGCKQDTDWPDGLPTRPSSVESKVAGGMEMPYSRQSEPQKAMLAQAA